MRCVRWWLRRWRPDLVPHGAALGASGPSPGRTTRRQLVVARSGAGSRHGPRWGRQVPAAAALVPAALAAAGHGQAEHQDEQDRDDDKQDAPHGLPPCPCLLLCAREPAAPQTIPHISVQQEPDELGPPWVRVTTVEHGHERSPTVAHGSEKPQVAAPSALRSWDNADASFRLWSRWSGS